MSVAGLRKNFWMLCGLLLAMSAQPAFAQAEDPWPVKGKLVGKHGDKSKDVSGIACTTEQGFPRSCLVIDDNVQAAQFVEVKDGELNAGDTIELIKDKFDGKPLELDGEGVAFADGLYYVIGSHGHPRDKKGNLDPNKDADEIRARISASSQIVRFPAGAGADAKVQRTSNLRKVIAAEPRLAPFQDQRLENNGLTIEGIAVKDGTLFAGFRGPVLDNERAAVLSVPVDALFNGDTTQHRLFRLPLGTGRGVRDLARFGDKVLVLAGPGADGPGTYAVYTWDGASENVERLSELSQFEPARKPEALLPLARTAAGLRVLILFDSDKEGTPTAVNLR